jgi:hypothetical protein
MENKRKNIKRSLVRSPVQPWQPFFKKSEQFLFDNMLQIEKKLFRSYFLDEILRIILFYILCYLWY